MSTLYDLRIAKGLSQQALADALHMSRVNYTNIENGKRNLTKDNAIKLSEILGVSVDVLFGLEKNNETDNPEFGRTIEVKPDLVAEDEVLIPVVASLRCGYDFAGDPYTILKRVAVPRSYVTRWGKNIIGVEAVGRSMMPTIRPHDICICVPGSAWENNNIVVIDVNDSDTIKRIRSAKDRGIDLVPDNQEYEPVHYSPEDLDLLQINVLGRVVKTIPPDL